MIPRKKKIIYRKKKRIPIYKKKWFWKIVLVIFVFFILAWFFLNNSLFEIKKIEISSPEKYKTKIREEVPEGENFFILNQKIISQNIKKEFPQIKNVKIEKIFPSTISVEVEERMAFGTFCSNQKKNYCFLMSSDGIIYGEAKVSDKYLLFIGDYSGNLKIGKEVIQKELIEEIISLIKELRKLKISIDKTEVLPFEIKIFTKDGFKIYFSKENFKQQTEILITILRNTIKPEEKKSLKYIDLRLLEEGERGAVYWK